jgi:hypothetical protein
MAVARKGSGLAACPLINPNRNTADEFHWELGLFGSRLRIRGESGIFAFNAASPAGVMRYLAPLASICFSIQPLAIILSRVTWPAGYSCLNSSPSVAFIFCNVVRSRL